MEKIIILYTAIFICFSVKGQKNQEIFYQDIKGIVCDAETNLSLSGVNVVINKENTVGTITDSTGRFAFTHITGRHNISFSHVGYQTQNISVFLNTGQECRLAIALKPDVTILSEVRVIIPFQKEKPINKLVYASGRSFSTEEAYRYAGTLGDAARMVRSYAGIMPERDDRNDIVIRGNSPIGLLWRLDGIKIPNPNHYGGIGLTGSTTTLLNINMLTNSDFLTGAFPAEFGNVLSGVFDLKMKKANPDKHEFRFQTGWNGFEFGAEGPFSKKRNIGTHMTCYRYSFLDVMNMIGINFGILPKYQDFTTNLKFDVSDKVHVSFIGLWGTSFIELDDHDREDEDIKTLNGRYTKTGSDMLLGGINLFYKINTSNKLLFSVSALRNEIKTAIDTFNLVTDESSSIWDERSTENKYSFFAEIENRSVKNNYLKAGMRWDTYDINYSQQGLNWNDIYATIVDSKEQMNLLRFYIQDEYRFTYKFRASIGMHSQYLLYNNSFAIEPRIGLQYKLTRNHILSLSYGKHHQMQARNLYFLQTNTADGVVLTNKNLDFSSADHLVVSYDWLVNNNFRIKTEAYYQDLQQIPIEDKANSVFSMLNTGANFYTETNDSLVNKGKGKNYGIELTIEKFLDKNYYFMFNGTLYQSKYTGGDGVWRNTTFNTSYILNGLAGYELWVTKNKAFGIDLKMTLSGGKPYIPVNEQASIDKGEVVYDYDRAYELMHNEYFRTDLKLYYRMNYKKFYIEFAVDLQNLTNNKNIFHQEFVLETGEYNSYYHMGFFPMYTLRCLF